MLQLSLRIMPAAVTAVITGTVLGATVYSAVIMSIFGITNVNIPLMIIAAILMILFCFVSGYIGARRIKTISVTELMTE
jgi:ABC-type antimicrobial peptide transport system permease subunit